MKSFTQITLKNSTQHERAIMATALVVLEGNVMIHEIYPLHKKWVFKANNCSFTAKSLFTEQELTQAFIDIDTKTGHAPTQKQAETLAKVLLGTINKDSAQCIIVEEELKLGTPREIIENIINSIKQEYSQN